MGSARRLASGIGWGGLSMAVVAGCQIIFLAVLARLLSPSDFGLVALANVSLRFLSYFAQMGVAPALVQKSKLEPGDVAAALAVSLSISMVCGVLAAAAAPLAAWFFAMPPLAGAMAALALTFPIQGFAAVGTGLLRREMRFRALGIIDAVAYVLGYGAVGIALATAGLGVWALVAAALAQTITQAVLTYAVARHGLALRHTRQARGHFLSYGGRYSLIGFIEFLSGNFDAMAVGKALGDSAAGLYNRTMTVANLPVQQPTTVITRALFPVLSAAGADLRRQAIGLQLSLLAVGGYAFAASAALAVAAGPVVHTLLGQTWLAVVPVLQVFALSVGPRFVTHVVGVSLDALGALRQKLQVQSLSLLLMVVAVVAALPHGLVVTAAAVVAVEVVRAGLLLAVAARALRDAPTQWNLTLPPLALVGLLSAGAVHLALWCVPGAPHWLALLVAMAAAGLAIVAACLLCRPWMARIEAIGWIIVQKPRLARFFPGATRP